VGAHDAARVYDAAPATKNKVSLQGYLRKVYSISTVYGFLEAPLDRASDSEVKKGIDDSK
jgi:hypothetical protein